MFLIFYFSAGPPTQLPTASPPHPPPPQPSEGRRRSGGGGRAAGSEEAATCESVGRRLPLPSPPPLLEDLFSQDGDREQEEIDRVTYITHPKDRALLCE